MKDNILISNSICRNLMRFDKSSKMVYAVYDLLHSK